MKTNCIFFALWLLAFSPIKLQAESMDHKAWDTLLKKHVNDDGWVDYKGFQRDSTALNAYLEQLSNNSPQETWTRQEQLAYWINAYNAYTVKLILDYYPVSSIRDIGSKIFIPFISSPWDIKFIKIGGKKYDLNNIEHSIIRKEFDEPRIHFAVVCAAYSCPKLRNEAYIPEILDQQLDDAARNFINNPENNIIHMNEVQLSKLFSWYKGDFTKSGDLLDFISKYSDIKPQPNAKINYLDYDWSLNEQQ